MDQQKIKNQASNEEARKITLENRFAPSVKSLFSRMMDVFENVYLATGMIVDFGAFKDDWTSILKVQYGRVGKEFLNNALKSMCVYDMIVKQDDDDLTFE